MCIHTQYTVREREREKRGKRERKMAREGGKEGGREGGMREGEKIQTNTHISLRNRLISTIFLKLPEEGVKALLQT